MVEVHDTQGMLLQNLVDAGCDENTTALCMKCAEEHEQRKMLVLLSRHRQTLLQELHKFQKQIDCLDFLIYRIETKKI